jgi:hypothetical protein
MRSGFPIICALAVLLAGCATTLPPPTGLARQPDQPVGYRYSDNFHPNWVSNASPEAIENAKRGTWLWPPGLGAGP